jgi:hypothetical protein
MHTCVYACIYMHTCVYACIYRQELCKMVTSTRIFMYDVSIYMYMYMHMYTHTHTYSTPTPTYTRSQKGKNTLMSQLSHPCINRRKQQCEICCSIAHLGSQVPTEFCQCRCSYHGQRLSRQNFDCMLVRFATGALVRGVGVDHRHAERHAHR